MHCFFLFGLNILGESSGCHRRARIIRERSQNYAEAWFKRVVEQLQLEGEKGKTCAVSATLVPRHYQ